jgi:RNA polymerase sigma factor (sigma-70 family)
MESGIYANRLDAALVRGDAVDPASLSRRVFSGDPLAETQLVQRFGPQIYRTALAWTRDFHAAEELRQEVLLQVLLALRDGKLCFPESLESYVFGILRNLVKQYFYSLKRERERVVSLYVAISTAIQIDISDSLSAEHKTSQEARLVQLATAELDETARRILCLTSEGMDPSEIAIRLHISANVIRVRKCRSLRKVRKYIQRVRAREEIRVSMIKLRTCVIQAENLSASGAAPGNVSANNDKESASAQQSSHSSVEIGCAWNSQPLNDADKAASLAAVGKNLSAAARALGIEPLWLVEMRAILAAMQRVDGDKRRAARFLGIALSSLYRKLKEYESAVQPHEQDLPCPGEHPSETE